VLEGFSRDAHPDVVQDAALRLVELGEIGVNRLARLLTATTPPAAGRPGRRDAAAVAGRAGTGVRPRALPHGRR